ncbi:MAG: MraY family glycosyltransferase [Planctomycetota bacterium]
MTVLAALLGALLACALLAPPAASVGWTDQPEGAPDRKERDARVPLVGGAAVLLGVALSVAFGADAGALPWPAFLGAFVLGLVDDLLRSGLPAHTKFAGQLLVAALFALHPGSGWGSPTPGELFALGALAVVAMNAINLFDHADGLVGGLCALALAGSRPFLAAAFLGFLPFNTVLRRELERDPALHRTVPRAFLGDSGSHLAGIAILATPASAWLLVVPVLDAVRVAVTRVHRGAPPWVGDRTHLGHRVAALGAGPTGGALLVLALSAPLVLVPALARGDGPLLLAASLATLGYAVALWITDSIGGDAEEGSGPVDGPPLDVEPREIPAARAERSAPAPRPAEGHTAGPFADA